MIKTFIYGDPDGFDFYEKDSAYNEYVKGFYISSRKGRRLMVNRRDNGVTTYNYLRYGLREAIARPTNAFFGMTLVVDGSKYCPQFHTLLDFFDYIFERAVKETSLFSLSEQEKLTFSYEDGKLLTPLKYDIHKFEECSKDIEWLKSNLPNIFSQQGGAYLVDYDKTFAKGKTGQVAGLNDRESDEYILSLFRKYQWITLSPEYQKHTDVGTIDGGNVIELSYEDLSAKRNEYNQILLPIAVDISKGSVDELRNMQAEVQESVGSMKSYIPQIRDKEDAARFQALHNEYHSILDSIIAILKKLSTSDVPFTIVVPPEEEDTKRCLRCQQIKKLSEFRSSETNLCLSCEEDEWRQNPTRKRKCEKCGKYKQTKEFPVGSKICASCLEKEEEEHNTTPPQPSQTLPKPSFLSLLNSPITGVAVLFVILLVAYFLLFPDDKPKPQPPTPVVEDNSEEYSENNLEFVDIVTLQHFLDAGNVTEAYSYIQEKKDGKEYENDIRNAIEQLLWNLIDGSESLKLENIKGDIQTFYLKNRAVCDALGAYNQDYWYGLAKDYLTLYGIIQQQSVNENDVNKGVRIIEKYPNRFSEDWRTKLNNARSATIAVEKAKKEAEAAAAAAKQKDKGTEAKAATITVTYTPIDGQKAQTINVTANKAVYVKPGTNVTVIFKGNVKLDGKKYRNRHSITAQEGRTYVFHCGEIGITIYAKKATQHQTFDL